MTSTVSETTRLQALRDLHVLDTAPEDRFDRVVRLAQRLLDDANTWTMVRLRR